jgi:hypothetical protein
MKPVRPPVLAVCMAAASLLATPARAADLSWSAFGTLALSQSNRGWHIDRFTDRHGTLKSGSLLGAQADLRLTPQWSATVQLKLAPKEDSDHGVSLTPSWAFVAWRPTNEWLVRAGKLRMPIYLQSESLDVGVSHDMARLPVEMYSIIPSNDFTGLFVSRTWLLGAEGASELALDAYGGSADVKARFWSRDGVPGAVPAGAFFEQVEVRMRGLVLTWRAPGTVLRASVHDTRTRRRNGDPLPVTFPRVDIGPGLGYWRVTEALPGPPIETTDAYRNRVTTFGIEQHLGAGWRVAAEYARTVQRNSVLGSNNRGGYVAVFKQIDRITPYLSLSRLDTGATQMDWYQRLTDSPLPPMIPGADSINGAQRLSAESIYAAEQKTLALGAAYAVHAGGKLKLEWAHTRIGRVSRLVDHLATEPSPAHSSVERWTLSYSVAY